MNALEVSAGLRATARSLLLDAQAGIAVGCLAAARVPSILLKGPAIARWLYDEAEMRLYRDIDLLVSPAQFAAAVDALGEIGYVLRLPDAVPAELGPKERELVGPHNVCVDLHFGLLGINADAQFCWDELSQRTVMFRLGGGVDVPVLDIPARTMHLALHAAQNGPVDEKALTDLERGLTRVDRSTWREAARLAGELDGRDAFGAGLKLLPEGQQLASELSLEPHLSVELMLRTQSAPQESIFFERLTEAVGAKVKVALVARKLFPTDASLRASFPLASRGALGFACARVCHPVSLALRLRPAFMAWRRARRAVGRRGPRRS